jgi:hypothetical protein
MTTTPERTTPVRTTPASAPAAPATREDHDQALRDIAQLESIEQGLTRVLVILGIGGLIFTAVNVTLFAIEHDTHRAIAWMLDPLVSLSLLAALFIDGRLAAHGYKPGGWPFVLRWFAGLTTWLMNCWGALYPGGKFTGWPDRADPAGLVLHSAIPFLVIVLAEAGAGWRRFTLRKKPEYQAVVDDWKNREAERRRIATEKREKEDQRLRDEAEAERKRAADLEAEERKLTAELAAEEKRAAIETAKARDLADAETRRIQAEVEAKARTAELDRETAEAQERAAAEAREQQARIDRENAAHAARLEQDRIAAEAEAEAVKVKAADEARAAEEVRLKRRETAEARRASTALPAAEPAALPAKATALSTAIPSEATAIPTAEPTAPSHPGTALLSDQATAIPRKLTAVPHRDSTEADDVRGAEAKRRQIEEANLEAAILLTLDRAPTRKDFAAGYGRGETWGRDRYADAQRLLAEDEAFAAKVQAEAEQRTAALVTA